MKQKLRRIIIIALILAVYPVTVLTYTWSYVLNSDLEGGRRGPLDAYRHTLASAFVSYTIGSWAVDFTTYVCESDRTESGRMDIKNNRIGARIGAETKSIWDIESNVRKAIKAGDVLSKDPEQITWCPKEKWSDSKLW